MIRLELTDFEAFQRYTRGMLTQIANAKIGAYHNAPHMQEAVVVWRPGEGPALDYYPSPENITHVKTEPPKNTVDGGNYAFKDTLRILFEKAGAKKTMQPLILGMRKGEFDLSMHHGTNGINALFIRYNGPGFRKKLDAVTSISDTDLDKACRQGCKANCIEIEYTSQSPSVPHP